MTNQKIFIIAGETSGDIHGANLVKNIRSINPEIQFNGIGGQQMKEQKVELFFDIKDLAIIGITEIFGKISLLKSLLKKIEEKFRLDPPDAVILIDYPGFNFKVAKIAHTLNIPVIYYICPQIWAWAPWRIKKIKRYVSQAIVLFEFEKELYEKAGVPVEFVGHPIMDTIYPEVDRETALKYFNLEDAKRIIALMPGSRWAEIENHMPILIKIAKNIKDKLQHTKFIIPCAEGIDMESIGAYIKKTGLPIRVIKGKTNDVLNVSDFVFVASGTATLEVACFLKPMIIFYQTSFINWLMGKIFLIIPFFGLVNILAGKQIVPEYLKYEIDTDVIAEYAFTVLTDRQKYIQIQNDLKEVKNRLGNSGASRRAAEIVVKMIEK